jgi:hypothetical protein
LLCDRSARRGRLGRSLDSAADRLEPLPERARTGFFSDPDELDLLARFFGVVEDPFLLASALRERRAAGRPRVSGP